MKRRPEYDLKLIGKNLRHLRKRKGLSVDEVREYLCLGSVQAVYKYENGKNLPPADTMFALMELYGADLQDVTQRHTEEWYKFALPVLPALLVFELRSPVRIDEVRKKQYDRLMYYSLCMKSVG